ncbi:MAG TPA: adenylate/guanylate cyclase domain-containing protein [Thermoleophilaceae bacterium]|nr:adenylate/guanylate cyclase domain-containing protein [Thermoleophilaceae bacterium]
MLVGATDAGSLRSPLWGFALALPLGGLLLLLAAPSADVHWEHHPSHFWLVLGTAAVSTTLAFATSATALRRADARLFLISLSFLAAAGFLTLHALATPGVLLDGPNQGFTIATPVGLLLAAVFAGWSALPLPPARAQALMRHAQLLRAGLVLVMVVWAALSLGSVPPLDDPTPAERASGGLVALAVLALIPYAFAAWRYAAMAMRTGAPLLLAVASAFTLLAEAMVAVALARSWHASWWEWHLLMLMAFGAIAYSARREDGEERFSDLYLDQTAAGKREVSVMFADLEGFTSFSEGRDPREVSEMLNAYLRVAIPPIVREYDGEIDRLIGDAIMATWGTRGDQPDHARRAVEAALALQRETGRIAEEHPGWPRFRAAVNSGEVLVGVLGAESGRSYTVIGDTVNLAARLESQAPPGRVVIGGATLRALPGTRVEALAGIRVKGRADPVDAYLVDDSVSPSAPA